MSTELPTILKILLAKRYVVFDRGLLNLNLIGVRSSERRAGKFDDELHVVYKDAPDNWVDVAYPITTDPGLTYLSHPMRSAGCAILVPGQYRSAYSMGMHKGRYPALVQNRPMTICRDANADAILDVDERVRRGAVYSGVFGINIHAADTNPFDALDPERVEVGAWSAGCQVFQDSKDYREYWSLIMRASRVYGKSFTYTLLD